MAVKWEQLAYISDTVYGPGWNGIIGESPSKNAVYDEMETKADKGANSDITSMSGITGVISTPTNLGSKTTATWSKSIGSGGDYATWAAMIADMPDMIAHAVTVTIKAGTTLTETCELKNKHGLTNAAGITIQAEKYFPTSGVIPTADSATATTLRDAALATAAKGDDYFNGCWVFIVDGTGTNNGFVPITDYVDATGDVVVASWPGTQPDNTSRYLIVGALIDANGLTYGTRFIANTVAIYVRGVGIKNASSANFRIEKNLNNDIRYCGCYNAVGAGVSVVTNSYIALRYNGIVGNNTGNSTAQGGINLGYGTYDSAKDCGISDNLQRGILITQGQYGTAIDNFGDNNGTWGTYASVSGQANCQGTECSGSSGNHSNGTGDGSLAY